MNKKTFLITGGSGFLGSHLTQKLVKENRVVLIDIVNNLPQNIKQSVKFYHLDINSSKIKAIFKKERPQIIYHLAGPIALRREIDDPIFKKSLNVLGNLNNILKCCTDYKAEKIIFFSSGGAVYEGTKIIPTPENYPVHSTSLYGIANLIIEKYLKSYSQKYGLGFTILRFSNIYGPRQWVSGIIPTIIVKALSGLSPIIYGDGTQTRDFVFVDDAVEASVLAIKDNKNEIYNVSSGREISINEIFNKITKILQKRTKPIYQRAKSEEIKRSCLDNSRIKNEMGWKPKVNIDQGLKKTIDWYKKNYVK